MARKKSPTVPVSPVHGKVFWVDTKMRSWPRTQLVQLITGRGGVVQTGIDNALDYLVLADDRRSTPGRSQAEKAAARLVGAHFTTVYAHDLYALLIPQRAEALALLGGGPANKDAWEACIPPYGCPVDIDLAGADLSGLDLAGYRFHKVDLTGVKVEGTILQGAWIGSVSKVDFRRIGGHEGLTVSSSEDCNFDGLDLSKTSFHGTATRSTFRGATLHETHLGGSAWTQCDLTGADATGARSHGWRAVDLVAAQANFTRSSFTYGDFQKASFREATFLDADLSHTNFDGADLRGANLQRATLAEGQLKSLARPAGAKKLRQLRRRLSEVGTLDFAVAATYSEVRAATEDFLVLEAKGWKGARGSALLQDPDTSNFVRTMVWSAARHDHVRIASLSLDGRIIASVIMLVAQDTGYLWKIAYDEDFARFSPGVLLIEQFSQQLLTDKTVALVDSCAGEGYGMIEGLWSGRRAICDLMIGLGRGQTPAFLASLARERFRRRLREKVKAAYKTLRARF